MKWVDTLFCRSDLITVVDERTYRGAARTVQDLMASTDPLDLTRANSGLHAMRHWLRYESRRGSPRGSAPRAVRARPPSFR